MSTILFIDGLPSEFTNAHLKSLLARFGVVEISTVAHRTGTGCLPFGFVSMNSAAAANAARVALNGTVLCGTTLRVGSSVSPAFGWIQNPGHRLEAGRCAAREPA
jgi:RNA recognition motif-containing protein